MAEQPAACARVLALSPRTPQDRTVRSSERSATPSTSKRASEASNPANSEPVDQQASEPATRDQQANHPRERIGTALERGGSVK
ncbi:UNVERIFIED_CONTAM: hypothetical protein Slati_0212600 [Sesamum latifolium]|uniref:Uncharacterized protein n=1 Tax=Sesamum latifolium TaxID=2727402 RepID=A0AAW2YC10_9LAMI